MTTTTTKSAEAPEMPIADRLEHCAKFTGLDAVRELLLEAAAAVRKRDAVIHQAAEALENASPAAWASRVDSDTMKSIWRKHAEALVGLQELLAELDNAACRSVQKRLAAQQPAQATQAEVTDAQIVAAYIDWCKTNGTLESFARAILALRPERVPMTDEQISLEAHNADDRDWNDLRFRSSWHEGFLEGARFAEAHHGITAQAKKESA